MRKRLEQPNQRPKICLIDEGGNRAHVLTTNTLVVHRPEDAVLSMDHTLCVAVNLRCSFAGDQHVVTYHSFGGDAKKVKESAIAVLHELFQLDVHVEGGRLYGRNIFADGEMIYDLTDATAAIFELTGIIIQPIPIPVTAPYNLLITQNSHQTFPYKYGKSY